MGRRKRIPGRIKWSAIALFLCGICALTGLMAARRMNPFFAEKYEVQGIDVSHYQGDVDWTALRDQGVGFAFIKATEGSGYTDPCFQKNWQEAQGAQLYVGAYHFFSFDSPARTQAEHFTRTVGDLAGALPPAIDVEFYGDKREHPPDREQVRKELSELCRLLEEYYGAKPVIYTTYTVYFRYIRGGFEEYPLWIRNVYWPPGPELGIGWRFWQYTDRWEPEGGQRLCQGPEKYMDRNVFRAGVEELEALLVPDRDRFTFLPFGGIIREKSGTEIFPEIYSGGVKFSGAETDEAGSFENRGRIVSRAEHLRGADRTDHTGLRQGGGGLLCQ